MDKWDHPPAHEAPLGLFEDHGGPGNPLAGAAASQKPYAAQRGTTIWPTSGVKAHWFASTPERNQPTASRDSKVIAAVRY